MKQVKKICSSFQKIVQKTKFYLFCSAPDYKNLNTKFNLLIQKR